MKIAVVIPKYGLVGGAESFVFEITERLACFEKFQVHVFANKWRKGEAPVVFHKVPIISFPRWLGPVSFAYFVQKAIHSENVDLIHSHDRIFQFDLFTFHGVPHEIWVKEARNKHLSLFDRATAWVEKIGITNRVSPVILPVSNLVKTELQKQYSIPDSRIRVVHPGVKTEMMSSLNRNECRSEIRHRHNLSADDVVLLFVGMNFEIKRLDLVLKSMAAIKAEEKERKKLKIIVAGKGNIKKYQNLAKDLGIYDQVIFAGVTREVEKYYLASDIFTMPSRFDTFGLAVLEAMSAGLPVIISQKVGAGDIVSSGKNGYVLPENCDVPDMVEALAELMEKKRRVKMGEQGRLVALTYTWDRTAEQMAELYRNVFKKKNGSGA